MFCCFEIIAKYWFLSLEVGGGGVRMYLTTMPRRYSSQFLWVILRAVIYSSCIGSTLQCYNVNVAVADPIKLLEASFTKHVHTYMRCVLQKLHFLWKGTTKSRHFHYHLLGLIVGATMQQVTCPLWFSRRCTLCSLSGPAPQLATKHNSCVGTLCETSQGGRDAV